MLTYDSLIEQAKIREMPTTKIRGILREYLQILILKELSRDKQGKRLYFTGGTYLRLVHSIKRFSEDLDFNIDTVTKGEFEESLKRVIDGLRRIGIESNVDFDYWGEIYVAKLIFPAVERLYNVVSKYSKKEGIIIKVETNNPKWEIEKETHLISGFGEFYPIICTDRGALFADKIDAFTKKDRGRHLYDIIFMLSNRFPINKSVLATFGLEKEPIEIILDRIRNLSEAELKKQAEILRPFLFDEKEAELLVDAGNIIPSLWKRYGSK